MIVPRAFPPELLPKAASLRSKQRLPALTWIHPTNGAPLCRCAQPNSGLHLTKLIEDNELLHAIRTANTVTEVAEDEAARSVKGGADAEPARKGWKARAVREDGLDGYTFGDLTRAAAAAVGGGGGGGGEEGGPMLHIFDARPYLNAGANALKGKGYESITALGGPSVASLIFCDIGNIHVMRSSLQSLVTACSENHNAPDFWGQVAASKWLEHLGLVLRGSRRMAATLELGKPCIVHCSDGWDRTSQLSATSQLLLDPYYRTTTGFSVLVEKDWTAFGCVCVLRITT